MGRMSPEQLAELAELLTRTNTAAPELVVNAVRWQRDMRFEPISADADRLAYRTADAVPPIARNLLVAETELATIRETVARLVVANDRGDDYSLADLRHELKRAGLDLTPEYTAAEDLARATESEAL